MQHDSVLLRLIDGLIAPLSQFADHLVAMQSLIKSEHEAVSEADLSSVEGITQKKVLIVEAIESIVRNLKTSAQALAETLEEEVDPHAVSLSEVATLVGVVLTRYKNPTIHENCNRVVDLIEECQTIHQTLNPAIKTNKRMLDRMLQFQRENQRFWQEVARDSESTYGADGARRQDGLTKSAIKVSI